MAYPKIEGERLDVALQRLREKGDNSAIPATDVFKALLSQPADKPTAEGSTAALLVDYTMPIIKDTGILHEDRAIMLFKQLRQMVQEWKESPDTIQRVLQAIDDELARYSDLRERRGEGIAA